MNRRNFLRFLATATVGTGVVYSFPSTIISKNIQVVSNINTINLITKKEIFPKLIYDLFFIESPFLSRLRFEGFKPDPDNPDIMRGRVVGEMQGPKVVGVIRNVAI